MLLVWKIDESALFGRRYSQSARSKIRSEHTYYLMRRVYDIETESVCYRQCASFRLYHALLEGHPAIYSVKPLGTKACPAIRITITIVVVGMWAAVITVAFNTQYSGTNKYRCNGNTLVQSQE